MNKKIGKFELINGVWENNECYECCSDCSGYCGEDCPLEIEGTCDNCTFKIKGSKLHLIPGIIIKGE